MQRFTTYILYSKTLQSYYIGFTGDTMEHRLNKHLALHKGHTGKAKDWQVCYTEVFATKAEAMQREKQLKSWKNKVRIAELVAKGSTG